MYEKVRESIVKSPNGKRQSLHTAQRVSPGKVYRTNDSNMTRMEYEEEINFGLWEEGKRVMWFEKEYQRERIQSNEMDVSQFMSTKNAMAGAPKQSFKNFNTPGNFEERVSEVKEKVDKLLEYQENDIAF